MNYSSVSVAWITLALLFGVVLFFGYLVFVRYKAIKDAKEELEAKRMLHKNFSKIIKTIVDQLQEKEDTDLTASNDRDIAHVFKKYCQFVGYPFRIEVDIEVKQDCTHVSIIHPKGPVGQQMYALKIPSGRLAALVTSDKFVEKCMQTGFHIYGY